MTLVQLSDLHLQRVASHEHLVAAAVNRIAPDLLVITGDSIDKREKLPELEAFLALLDADMPKVAILGNWEYACDVNIARLAEVYAARNCRLLVNETAVHVHTRTEVLITGMDDILNGRPDISGALRRVEPRPNHLILAHCPAYRDVLRTVRPAAGNRWSGLRAADSIELARFTPSCILSGHTHGGQVNLFGFAPWRPQGSGRYLSGWYRDGQPVLFVSRGIGTVELPIRLGATPEVARFDWFLA